MSEKTKDIIRGWYSALGKKGGAKTLKNKGKKHYIDMAKKSWKNRTKKISTDLEKKLANSKQ